MNTKEFKRLLGQYIRFAREEQEISRETLSQKTGLDRKTIERIEYGKTDPKSSTLCKLEENLNINISEIYSKIRKQLLQDYSD